MINCDGSTLGTMADSLMDVCENSVCFLCDFSGEYICLVSECFYPWHIMLVLVWLLD